MKARGIDTRYALHVPAWKSDWRNGLGFWYKRYKRYKLSVQTVQTVQILAVQTVQTVQTVQINRYKLYKRYKFNRYKLYKLYKRYKFKRYKLYKRYKRYKLYKFFARSFWAYGKLLACLFLQIWRGTRSGHCISHKNYHSRGSSDRKHLMASHK